MKEGVFCSLSRKRKSILRGFRSAKLAPFVDINLDADDEEKKSARENERNFFPHLIALLTPFSSCQRRARKNVRTHHNGNVQICRHFIVSWYLLHTYIIRLCMYVCIIQMMHRSYKKCDRKTRSSMEQRRIVCDLWAFGVSIFICMLKS